MAVVVVGLVVARNIRQEIYPLFELDTVDIRMQYRGASPEEVERGVILAIEEVVQGLDGDPDRRPRFEEGSLPILGAR